MTEEERRRFEEQDKTDALQRRDFLKIGKVFYSF